MKSTQIYIDRPDITPARLKLLADRLCFISQGQEGLTFRHGHQKSIPGWRDQFDSWAEAAAPEMLPVKELPTLLLLPTLATPAQPTLPGLF